MLGRALTLAGGVAGAAGLSQFPEFSQQYVQRLGGAVDELGRFVAEFDADAAEIGLSRDAALDDLAQGGAMGAQRAETMENVILRYQRLNEDLASLQGAGPFTRAHLLTKQADAEITEAAWDDFQPAVPLTAAGGMFAGVGFFVGLGLFSALLTLLRAPFRRGRARAA
ncbi:Protein of unknown function [Roseovarius nanhaiticus]|uniref:DUF2937 family protein n=1 Tax=Roseovarius nanhaiticus TaxID=573024 RepID=A0A1N7HE15_9RHOB|nr:DUF2937 family protein [Roseovarius nanhaiticus]SEL00410.1 Protein of unknown function [Roseovarius nanhaiticus]SIS23072.1 Protein of unknown function [Roseovarius nanhaiticus]